jgi:hypothetical protein
MIPEPAQLRSSKTRSISSWAGPDVLVRTVSRALIRRYRLGTAHTRSDWWEPTQAGLIAILSNDQSINPPSQR